MSQAQVLQLLGHPLGSHEGFPGVIRWYGPPGTWIGEDGELHAPSGEYSKAAIIAFDLPGQTASVWGPYAGRSAEEVQAELGVPVQVKLKRSVIYWQYSRSDGNYYRRWIGFGPEARVAEKVAFFWWD